MNLVFVVMVECFFLFQTLYASVINGLRITSHSQNSFGDKSRKSHRLARIQITDLSVTVCFYTSPNVSPTCSLANIHGFLQSWLWIGELCGIVIPDFFFLFSQRCDLWTAVGRGAPLHTSPIQIARKLFHSHPVANEIGRCLSAPRPAGTGTDHQPNLTTMLRVPRQNKPTQLR